VIHALADAQHRVVSRKQLLGEGIGSDAVRHRLRLGRLRAVHNGVYAVGPGALIREGRWMAAVLACGPDAVLSHRAAAALWGIVRNARATVDVTATRRLPARKGITTHFARLPFDEITTHNGIPTTTVPRTLADLAATDTQQEELEKRFKEFLARTGLPRPRTNAIVETDDAEYEVDCLWETRRLIVELDGRETHLTPQAFERDRRLATAGYTVVRLTWRQLRDEPALVEKDLRRLLVP